jgi:predicted permease
MRSDEDFAEEIRSHIELEAARLEKEQGLNRDDALAAARRAFGNRTRTLERFHENHHWRWLERIKQDVRFAFRQWRKRPGWAATALLTLALGTGVNIALFRVIWSVLLVEVASQDNPIVRSQVIDRWHLGLKSFEALGEYDPWRVTVESGGDPEPARAIMAAPEWFKVLGAAPARGRLFTGAEMGEGRDGVVVLADSYWRRRFQADSGIVGKIIRIGGESYQVLGILPAGFDATAFFEGQTPELFFPSTNHQRGGFGRTSSYVIARLREGVTPAAAKAELEAAAATVPDNRKRVYRVSGLQQRVGARYRSPLLALFCATFCTLLLAVLNVAGLLLAQAATRQHELAVRAALGAGRWRLITQMLTEAALLAIIGGLLGGLTGTVLSRVFLTLYPETLPLMDSGPAWLICALLCGLIPALQAGGVGLRAGRSVTGPSTWAWRHALVAAQVSVACVLLVASGLLVKSFVRLRSIDPGFAREHVWMAQVMLPDKSYPNDGARAQAALRLNERLRAIPGVRNASIINTSPFAYRFLMTVRAGISGHADEVEGAGRAVAGDYFDALGLRMAEGRPLTRADDSRKDVIVVNEAFARRYYPHGGAIGNTLEFGDKAKTIVGVVRDLRNVSLRDAAQPEIYFPFPTLPGPMLDLVIRAYGDPATLTPAVRAELRAMDGSLAVEEVTSMEAAIDQEVAAPRFQSTLVGLFGALGLGLAMLGIYGVIAHIVRARSAEFGVRMALGAGPRDILRLVLRRGLIMPLIGLCAGLALSAGAARAIQSFLYGVEPRDASVFIAVALLLFAACVAACLAPARRAAMLDPARTLRTE